MPEIKCPVCNYKVAETAKFCPDCGAPMTTKKPKRKASGGKSNSLRDSLIIVGALAVIAIGYFIVKKPEAGPQPPQNQQQNFGGTDHPDVGADEGTMSVLANLPTDYNSLVRLGHQTMDAGNYALAAECYKRALAIDGSSHDVRTDYGACLHGMGLPERALQEFYRVIREHPEHSIANFNIGIVYYTIDQPDSAKFYWEKYLELDPNGNAAESARQYLKQVGG